MKKCTYCGQEYPDQMTTCPQDGNPLPVAPSAGPPPLPVPSSGLAITSLILGCVSLLCGPFTGIPAVICGHLALNRARREPGKYGGSGLATAGLAPGYVGCTLVFIAILAGMLLPALARAKYKAQQITCVNNLKQVGLAYRIWAGDHKNNLPHSILDLTNELGTPNLLICPADPNHTRAPAGSPAVWNSANFSYEFLVFDVPEDQVLNRVIVRCPIHNNELRGDGSVMMVRAQRRP